MCIRDRCTITLKRFTLFSSSPGLRECFTSFGFLFTILRPTPNQNRKNRFFRSSFKYSSQQLRIWNEVATIFLVPIVMLATVKSSVSWFWGLVGLIGFVIVLMSAIKIYKSLRKE